MIIYTKTLKILKYFLIKIFIILIRSKTKIRFKYFFYMYFNIVIYNNHEIFMKRRCSIMYEHVNPVALFDFLQEIRERRKIKNSTKVSSFLFISIIFQSKKKGRI